jgi:hypothetical protein
MSRRRSPRTSRRRSPRSRRRRSLSTSRRRSPRSRRASSLTGLIGQPVHGTIQRSGEDYYAVVVTRVGPYVRGKGLEDALVRMSRDHLRQRHVPWKVGPPRSWPVPSAPKQTPLGPHVSLHSLHRKDVGRRVRLRVRDVMVWEENHRWVALELEGPLTDRTEWLLHLSTAQEPL